MPQRFAILFALLLLLIACQPGQSGPVRLSEAPWVYTDLRLLDADDAPQPNLDLLAAYTRQSGSETQVRLDVLDLTSQLDYDLYLALDTSPGGTTSLPLQATAGLEWDTLLVIPASGHIQALASSNDFTQPAVRRGLGIRVVRDPALDTLTISFNPSDPLASPSGFNLQAFLAPAGSLLPADSLGPVSTSAPPPARSAVLFAFWDSLTAYTPVQALRRWDGAHTGPLGGRHGLYNLLRTARSTRTPVTLLDLKNPTSLAALDFAGGLELVKEMSAEQLLILPEALPAYPSSLPGWVQEGSANESWQVGLDFGLPASPFRYAPAGLALMDGLEEASAIFIPQPEPGPAAILSWGGQRIILIPALETSSEQATLEGPTLEVRRDLVRTALAAGQGQPGLLVLGGDLPASQWGNPQIARATFNYLAAHPWIHPLDAYGLLAIRPSPASLSPNPFPSEISPVETELLNKLLHAPSNPAGLAAWQAYRALYAPVFPAAAELPALRLNYLGQVNALLAAAGWADCSGETCSAPASADCSVDPDLDGLPECILSSGSIFTLLEPQGGSLLFAFTRSADGVHQLIAPSSQFITGLSDSSGWDLSRGLSADPGVIPGAFADPGELFEARAEGGQVIFTSQDGSLRKTFRLTAQGLHVEIEGRTNATGSIQIPLSLDPWLRFTPGWADFYQSSTTGLGWVWEVQPASPAQSPLRVEIQTSAALIAHSFTESRQLLGAPEDPNREVPPGNFLPFPVTLVEIQATEDFYVQLNVDQPIRRDP